MFKRITFRNHLFRLCPKIMGGEGFSPWSTLLLLPHTPSPLPPFLRHCLFITTLAPPITCHYSICCDYEKWPNILLVIDGEVFS